MGGGGPSNFIVYQSPNLWIFGFKTFDLDFGLDNYTSTKVEKILSLAVTCFIAR